MLVIDAQDTVIASEIVRLAHAQHLDLTPLRPSDIEQLEAFATDLFRTGGRRAVAQWIYGLDAATGVALMNRALWNEQGDAVLQLRAFPDEDSWPAIRQKAARRAS